VTYVSEVQARLSRWLWKLQDNGTVDVRWEERCKAMTADNPYPPPNYIRKKPSPRQETPMLSREDVERIVDGQLRVKLDAVTTELVTALRGMVDGAINVDMIAAAVAAKVDVRQIMVNSLPTVSAPLSVTQPASEPVFIPTNMVTGTGTEISILEGTSGTTDVDAALVALGKKKGKKGKKDA